MPVALFAERELAKSLYIQGFGPAKIGKKIRVKPATIMAWVNRHRWQELRDKVDETLQAPLETAKGIDLAKHSADIRETLAQVLTVQAQSLVKEPVSLSTLRNTPDGQGLAAVTKTIAESAALVHGWGSEKAGTIIVVDDLRSFDQETKPAQVTDVQDVK